MTTTYDVFQINLLYRYTYILHSLENHDIWPIGQVYLCKVRDNCHTIADGLNDINIFLVKEFFPNDLILLNLFRNINTYLLLVVQWIVLQLKEVIKSTVLETNVNNDSYMQNLEVKSGKDNQKLPGW